MGNRLGCCSMVFGIDLGNRKGGEWSSMFRRSYPCCVVCALYWLLAIGCESGDGQAAMGDVSGIKRW